VDIDEENMATHLFPVADLELRTPVRHRRAIIRCDEVRGVSYPGAAYYAQTARQK